MIYVEIKFHVIIQLTVDLFEIKIFHFPQTLLHVRCSMVLRSVSYFREREHDQGHDHVTHGDRGRGRGQVGQAHIGVNGIVKDEGRGEIICGLL